MSLASVLASESDLALLRRTDAGTRRRKLADVRRVLADSSTSATARLSLQPRLDVSRRRTGNAKKASHVILPETAFSAVARPSPRAFAVTVPTSPRSACDHPGALRGGRGDEHRAGPARRSSDRQRRVDRRWPVPEPRRDALSRRHGRTGPGRRVRRTHGSRPTTEAGSGDDSSVGTHADDSDGAVPGVSAAAAGYLTSRERCSYRAYLILVRSPASAVGGIVISVFSSAASRRSVLPGRR